MIHHHSQHSDWVLSLIIQMDRDRPGFCGEFFRASSERRQVLASFLAKRPPEPEQVGEVASLLALCDHTAILVQAHGEPPKGMRGALRRAGPIVHEQRFYTVLHKLLSTPRHAEVVKCINRLGSLDLTKLRIAYILPEPRCRHNVVEAISSVQSAGDLVSAMKLLVAAGANEPELFAAIRNVRSVTALAKVINRAMLKCRGPEHPVGANDSYRPISTAGELHKLALRYRNCARNYTIELLDQEAGHAFAEARHGREGAVVHLRNEQDHWRLEGVYGLRNCRPSPSLREHVFAHLAEHDIHLRERRPAKSAWDSVRRVAATSLFEFGFE